MKDLKKYAQKTFDNITLSKVQEERILNNILKKKTKIYFIKPIIVGSILLGLGTTLGIVYANDIKETFNTLIIKKEEKETKDGEKYTIVKTKSEGIAEINENANLSKIDKIKSNDDIKFKIKDLENELGINILKSNLSSIEYITQDNIELKNNKITRASFYMENISNELPDAITDTGAEEYDRNFTKCNMRISFKTQFFDKKSEDTINSVAPHGSKTEEYYIEKLNTTALIVKFEPDENSISKVWDVIFDYENITYDFTFFFRGTNPKIELKKFTDSLE